MTKKTLVTSLSLAAAALSLATVPVTSVYANEATAPTTGTQATQPFTAELTVRHSGEDKYEALVVTFRGTLDPGDGYVGTSINYRIKDRVTNSYETPEVSFTRYDKGTTSYTPTNDVGLRGLKDGSYAVEFYGDTGKLDGQLLTTTDFEIKREATSEAPAVTPKAEDNTDKKPEVTAPAPKV